jgi:curved DNA-binding protein CbpA
MDPAIAQWIQVLDKVTHFELLGVPPGSGPDALRRAYQGFAATFHPDAHAHRTPEERAAVNAIFKRGTEAFRVLSDGALRAKYEDQLAAKTGAPVSNRGGRPPPLPPGARPSESGGGPASARNSSAPAAPKPGAASNISGRLEDFVKQPKARPFAQQAEALAKKGEHAKAKLQLKLALNMDPGNAALEGYLKELDVLIEQDKRKPYVPK